MNKTIMLEDSAAILVSNLLKDVQKLKDDFSAKAEELKEDLQRQLDVIGAAAKDEHKKLWDQIFDLAGVADDSRRQFVWDADIEYFEHGLIFLRETDEPLSEDGKCQCEACRGGEIKDLSGLAALLGFGSR